MHRRLITDAAIEENVAAMVARCVSEFGGLEIFFANVGNTGTNTPLFEQTVEEWWKSVPHNIISCFLAVKHAGKHMTTQGFGSIILNSSSGVAARQWRRALLQRGKAAVNSLTRAAAKLSPAPTCASMPCCRA